jgi:hypothetical protein
MYHLAGKNRIKYSTVMKKYFLSSCTFLIFLFFFTQCITVENNSLDNDWDTITTTGLKSKGILFNSENADLSSWYSCAAGRPVLALADAHLQVSLDNTVGECFGIYFDPKDIRATLVIKLKAKYSGDNATTIDLLAGFVDGAKQKTYYPAKARLIKSGKFETYYFDYITELSLHEKQIDPGKVTSILFFINISGIKNVKGNLLIDEVSLVSKAPLL